jgi:hypothetical protein
MGEFELTAGASTGSYELPSAGSHPGQFIGVIFGGTHETPAINGQPGSRARKLLFIIELPGERRSDDKPHVILSECTASLHPKATLTKMVQAVTGGQLRDGERFDVSTLVGKPCIVSIVHETRGDRVYHRVSSIGAPIKGMPLAESTYPPLVWSVNGGQPFPDADWLPFHYGRSVADWVGESEEAMAAAQKAVTATPQPHDADSVADGDIAY